MRNTLGFAIYNDQVCLYPDDLFACYNEIVLEYE